MATTSSTSSSRSSAPSRRSAPPPKPAAAKSASPAKSASSPAKSASSAKSTSNAKSAGSAKATGPAGSASSATSPKAASKQQDRTSISSEARAGASSKPSGQVQNLTNGLKSNFGTASGNASATGASAAGNSAAGSADAGNSPANANSQGAEKRGFTIVFPDGTEFKPGANQPPAAEVLSGERQEGRRQVGVLDDFRGKGDAIAAPGLKTNLNHGEATAQAQERAGFGVTRIQQNGSQVADSMTDVANKIEKDGILKKGDVLNVSMGESQDPTFAQLSQATGLDLNRDNIGSQREQLFSRLSELKGDAGANKLLGGDGSIDRMLQTNEAVQRIQGQGVDVVHAAGNRGPDEVSVGFLNAKHQLSGTNAAGQVEPYSANHALTKPSQSTHQLREAYNPLTPAPIASGQGFSLQTPSGQVGEQLPGPTLMNQGLNVKSIEPGKIQLGESTTPQHGSEVLSPTSFDRTSVPLTSGGQGPVLGLAAGTSFANWDFIPNNFSARL